MPPDQGFYYPTSMALGNDGRYLYVVNSNFDQSYISGWLSVVDLDAVLAQDASTPALNPILSRAAGGQLRVLGLGAQLAISEDGKSALLAHRGTNSRGELMMTKLELSSAAPVAQCGDPEFSTGLTGRELATDCDEAHLVRVYEDGSDDFAPGVTPRKTPTPGALGDPYGSSVFSWTDAEGTRREMLAISYLGSGYVRLYENTDGDYSLVELLETPLLRGGTVGVLNANSSPFLIVGGNLGGSSRVASIDLTRSLSGDTDVVYTRSLAGNGGTRVFALAFTQDNDLLVANRSDTNSVGQDEWANSLVRLDTTLGRATSAESEDDDPILRPGMTVTHTSILNGRGTDVRAFVKADGQELVAVTAFDQNRLFLFSVQGDVLRLETRLDLDKHDLSPVGVGQGPVAIEYLYRDGRDILLVLNFYDHSLSVLDISSPDVAGYKLLTKVKHASE